MKKNINTSDKSRSILSVVIWTLFTLTMIKFSHILNIYHKKEFTEVIMDQPFIAVGIIILSALSFIAFYKRDKQLINGKVKRIILTIIAGIIIDFCFFGKALLFSDDGLWFVSDNLSAFIIMYIVSLTYFMVSEIALIGSSKVFYRNPDLNEKNKIVIHTAIIALIQLIVYIVYVYAFNPGNMSYDTFTQLREIRKITIMGTWHPIGHTLFMGLLLKIWDNLMVFSVFHIIMATAVISQWFYILLKKGIRPVFLYIVFFIIILSPSTGVNIVTHWKDIPFTFALIWGTSILFRMLEQKDFFAKPVHLIEFLIAMVMIGVFRHNGILSFIGMVIFTIYYIVKNRDKNQLQYTIALLTLTVTSVVFINWIYPNMIETNHNPPGMKMRPVFQGLGAVYVKGEEEVYSQKDREIVESVGKPQDLIDYYDAYFADVYSVNVPNMIENLSKHTTSELLSIYIDTMIKKPEIILGDKFNLAIGLWSVTEDKFSYNNRYTTIIQDVLTYEFGTKRMSNSLEPMLNDYLKYVQKEMPNGEKSVRTYIDTFFWRSGLYTVLSLLLIFFFMNKGKKYLIMFIPIAGNYFIVFLTMPAQDFRYSWFMVITFPMLLLSSMIALNRGDFILNRKVSAIVPEIEDDADVTAFEEKEAPSDEEEFDIVYVGKPEGYNEKGDKND